MKTYYEKQDVENKYEYTPDQIKKIEIIFGIVMMIVTLAIVIYFQIEQQNEWKKMQQELMKYPMRMEIIK